MANCYASLVSDVLVIGGGLNGVLSAWRLAERGLAVTVLDDARTGAASAAAAGILGAQAETLVPSPLFDFALASRARYGALAHALSEDIGYRPWGALARGGDYAWQLGHGARVERRDDAWFFADDAQVDPPLLLAAAMRSAVRAGVVFANETVLAIDGQKVRTSTAARSAKNIVIAAGAWASALAPVVVTPVHGVLCEVVGPRAPAPVVFARDAYRVTRGDGRVLLGFTADATGFETQITEAQKAQLFARAFTLAPELREARVLRIWSGLRPHAPRGMPYLYKQGSVVVAAGQHRNGILFAPLVAECVEALVCGEAPPFDLQPFAIESSANSGKWSERSLHG